MEEGEAGAGGEAGGAGGEREPRPGGGWLLEALVVSGTYLSVELSTLFLQVATAGPGRECILHVVFCWLYECIVRKVAVYDVDIRKSVETKEGCNTVWAGKYSPSTFYVCTVTRHGRAWSRSCPCQSEPTLSLSSTVKAWS